MRICTRVWLVSVLKIKQIQKGVYNEIRENIYKHIIYMYRAYKVEPVIIGSGKSLFSPRVFFHRLGLTTTNTWNLVLQTICVRLSCKGLPRVAEDLPRHVAMVRVAPGSDVHLF